MLVGVAQGLADGFTGGGALGFGEGMQQVVQWRACVRAALVDGRYGVAEVQAFEGVEAFLNLFRVFAGDLEFAAVLFEVDDAGVVVFRDYLEGVDVEFGGQGGDVLVVFGFDFAGGFKLSPG